MTDKDESKTQYIRERLLEAGSEEELDEICYQLKADPDIADGSVDAEKSKLKKKGEFQFRQEPGKALVANKPLPIESLIKELYLPPMVDGTRTVFDAGVEYGMKSILIGVRIAQELSKMGIDQATPIIKMAQEMRQTEGQVARDTGLAMGGEIAGRLLGFIDERLPQGGEKVDIASTPDPMKGLMARTMETILNRLMGMMLGGQAGPTPGLVDKRNQGGQK